MSGTGEVVHNAGYTRGSSTMLLKEAAMVGRETSICSQQSSQFTVGCPRPDGKTAGQCALYCPSIKGLAGGGFVSSAPAESGSVAGPSWLGR